MARRPRVFVEISDYMPLDHLISAWAAIRDGLPRDAEPQLVPRGDNFSGRQLKIAYLRNPHSRRSGERGVPRRRAAG